MCAFNSCIARIDRNRNHSIGQHWMVRFVLVKFSCVTRIFFEYEYAKQTASFETWAEGRVYPNEDHNVHSIEFGVKKIKCGRSKKRHGIFRWAYVESQDRVQLDFTRRQKIDVIRNKCWTIKSLLTFPRIYGKRVASSDITRIVLSSFRLPKIIPIILCLSEKFAFF